MYILKVDNLKNQTIKERKLIIDSHKDEEIIVKIDNSKNFKVNEWLKFQFPLYSEGISKIVLKDDNSNINALINEAKKRETFLHNDLWHGKESLKEHNDRIKFFLAKEDAVTDEIVLLHDFGKPITAKQNPKYPNYLCYYNHENIGAREILSYLSSTDLDKFYKAIVICNYHMLFANKDYSKMFLPESINCLEKEGMIDFLSRFSEADLLES